MTRAKQIEISAPLTIGVEISSRESLVPIIGARTPLVDMFLCVCGNVCLLSVTCKKFESVMSLCIGWVREWRMFDQLLTLIVL